jgi:hypothetical protein
MENTIDLRKTGAENIIGKFSKKHSSQHIIPVRENGSFIVGATFYMTARQAEILMLSDSWKNAQVVILSIVRIENQEANVM